MNHQLIKNVYNMYHEYKVGWSENCQICQDNFYKKKKKELIGPLPIYHVGEDYGKDDLRLLIYGYVAYGWSCNEGFTAKGSGWKDKNAENYLEVYRKIESRVKDLFEQKYCRLFGSIKAICERIYGDSDQGYKKIAISNLIKCNHGEKKEKTLPTSVKAHCANKCHGYLVAAHETKVLAPTHVLVLSKTDYPKHFDFIPGWNNNMKFLILPHPSSPRSKSNNWYAEQTENFIKGNYDNFSEERTIKNGIKWQYFSLVGNI